DAHIAAERQRADRVLGLAPAHARELRWEEQREALDAHANRLRDGEVPELVQDDQQDDPEDREGPTHSYQCGKTPSLIRVRPLPAWRGCARAGRPRIATRSRAR